MLGSPTTAVADGRAAGLPARAWTFRAGSDLPSSGYRIGLALRALAHRRRPAA